MAVLTLAVGSRPAWAHQPQHAICGIEILSALEINRAPPSSGGIDSAHAGVSNKPRATNAAQHGWIQNATKWFDRHEVRSREPRHPADVDSQYNRYPFGQLTKAVQMKPWTVLLRVSRSASPGN